MNELGEDPLGEGKESNLLIGPSMARLFEKQAKEKAEQPESLELIKDGAAPNETQIEKAAGGGIGGGITSMRKIDLSHQESIIGRYGIDKTGGPIPAET